jgi:hypothetical protein
MLTMADSDVDSERTLKRRRIAQACESCRSMKAKCNGGRPRCDRCEGYGYSCWYAPSRSRKRRVVVDSRASSVCQDSSEMSDRSMNDLLDAYDKLLREVRDKLPEPEKVGIDTKWMSIKNCIPSVLSQLRLKEALPTPLNETRHIRLARPLVHSRRYLGEVSDVRFFNLVRRVVLANGAPDGRGNEGMDSYEQDDPIPQRLLSEVCLELPSPEVAEEYIEIYFTTIHIAYPFIPKSTFIRVYRKLRASSVYEDMDTSWVALLCESVFHLYSLYLTI